MRARARAWLQGERPEKIDSARRLTSPSAASLSRRLSSGTALIAQRRPSSLEVAARTTPKPPTPRTSCSLNSSCSRVAGACCTSRGARPLRYPLRQRVATSSSSAWRGLESSSSRRSRSSVPSFLPPFGTGDAYASPCRHDRYSARATSTCANSFSMVPVPAPASGASPLSRRRSTSCETACCPTRGTARAAMCLMVAMARGALLRRGPPFHCGTPRLRFSCTEGRHGTASFWGRRSKNITPTQRDVCRCCSLRD